MAIFRGVGGSGDSSDNSYLQEVTAQANAASASAVLAQASANSILTLTAATGDAGTDVSYNASTGVLTVPRGADGTDASVTAANVTGVLTGGTGISIASNGTITNDSPDQTVALTGTGATTITGTYPNFTINSVNTTYTVGDGGLTTNDFTDADHSKLDGIEAIADVTDTANVTAAGAAMLTGATFTGDVLFNDGVKAKFGTDSDLLIYHNDGEPSVIEDAGELGLVLKTNGSIFAVVSDADESMITATPNAGVTLHYNGINKVNVGESAVAISEDLSVAAGSDLYVLGGDLDVTGDIIVSGTVDGRDVAADGTKLDGIERTVRQRFQRRGYNNTLSFKSLTTTFSQVGSTLRINSGATTAVENVLDLNISANFGDVNSTNDGLFVVTVDAPNPSNETTVNLGTVTGASLGVFTVSGDFTKHFSPYCGLSTNSDGSNAFNFSNQQGWDYNPVTDKTNVYFYAYQSNTPSIGSTVYLHPFDWETTGTEINGDEYPIDTYNAAGTVNVNQFQQIYLGYYKPERTFKIKARETGTTENISLARVSGTYSQIIGS